MRLIKKNGVAPGATENTSHTLKGVRYEVYADGAGWKNAENGDMAGTTGEARRLGALRVYVGDEMYTGGIPILLICRAMAGGRLWRMEKRQESPEAGNVWKQCA